MVEKRIYLGLKMSLLNDCHTVSHYFLWGINYHMNPESLAIPLAIYLFILLLYTTCKFKEDIASSSLSLHLEHPL